MFWKSLKQWLLGPRTRRRLSLGTDLEVQTTETAPLSPAQLNQVRLGREAGLSERQVQSFAKSTIDAFKMWEIREELAFVADIPFLTERYRPPVLDNLTPKYVGWVATMGGVFGDIAGSQYEFNNCSRTGITVRTAFSRHSHFTDDSVLLIATLETVKNKSTSNELQMLLEKHRANVNNEKLPFGVTAYSKNYKKYYSFYPSAGYGSGFVGWALEGKGPYRSFGNGAAMRVAPIGEFFQCVDDVITHAIASAACTHNHPEGIKGAVITAVCVWMARNGYSKGDILAYVKKHYANQKMVKRYTMSEVRRCDQGSYAVSCQFSVPAAVTCFYESQSYYECIENALSFVGDSDTIACIAGSIAAAFYGRIPEFVKTSIFEHLPHPLRRYFQY